MMRPVVWVAAAAVLALNVRAEPVVIETPQQLKPVMDYAWMDGDTCDQPGPLTDWVFDIDGGFYQRSEGMFTPLTSGQIEEGVFSTSDQTGIGTTLSFYRLQADDSLRLWTEAWYEDDDTIDGVPVIHVKDGMWDGEATPSLKRCPQRTRLFGETDIVALNGSWSLEGGSCEAAKADLTFDLRRPIPRIRRGGDSEAFALELWKDMEMFRVTEGSAMEAIAYTVTIDADGTLVESGYQGADAPPRRFRKCPGP